MVAGLFGVAQTGPLVSLLPILIIGVIFGLAMDYQVFLVSRMHEEVSHGATPTDAVRDGFRHSARVVTAAGLIMISVFSGFILPSDPIIKSIGLAFAAGILIDAFLVRMTLIPAVMTVLGRAPGGCRAGSTGSCRTSTSRAPRSSSTPPSPRRRARSQRPRPRAEQPQRGRHERVTARGAGGRPAKASSTLSPTNDRSPTPPAPVGTRTSSTCASRPRLRLRFRPGCGRLRCGAPGARKGRTPGVPSGSTY